MRSFRLNNLKRVNLLVGANNCGKTTVLEALELLGSRSAADIKLRALLRRRGEALLGKNGDGDREFDIRHLFRGHKIQIGSWFQIEGKAQDSPQDFCRVEIRQSKKWLSAHLSFSGGSGDNRLTDLGGLGPTIDLNRERWNEAARVQYIGTASVSAKDLEDLWESIALTPGEEILIKALKAIEPDLERIAFVGFGSMPRSAERGGFMVRRRGSYQPVPIGSLGDGIWRMFTTVMAGLRASGGFLLVDEIDTGLHYSAMADLWKTAAKMSQEADIQVFATTHSYDCVYSLASLVAEGKHPGVFSIHRIEPDRGESVALSEDEIAILAERDIEIR